MTGGKIFKVTFYLFISVILLAGVESCKKDNGNEMPPGNSAGSLEPVSEITLDVTEPSGLSFGPGDSTLLVVSDNTNKVYEMTLEGNVIRELAYSGNDLEGVTCNPFENKVVVTEERKRQLVVLDYSDGTEQERFDIPTGGNTDNKGPEGVSYNTNNRVYYIVNEDLPGELILWSNTLGVISTTPLHFASDYSAIFTDAKNALIYIVSDESKALYKCDYNANVITGYPLPDTKFEGIAVDSNSGLIYLVNDKTRKLYIFKILN